MYTREELKQLKVEFWEGFAAYCEVQPYLRGRKKMWRLYDTKVKGVELKFDATRTEAEVILEVNHRREEDRLAMFEKLTWYKESLEKGLPDEVIWDICYTRESGEEVARVYVCKEGIDIHRRSHWGDFFQFMASRMYQLEKNFLSIADYVRE